MYGFDADIEEIRRRATEKLNDSAVTASYQADRQQVIEALNDVLAAETVWRPAATHSTAAVPRTPRSSIGSATMLPPRAA